MTGKFMANQSPAILASAKVSDDAIAGAFAGVVARLFTAPFDVIKIRFQLQQEGQFQYKSIRHAFRSIVSEEGFFSLWKGNISATYLWISYAVVQFSVYGYLKNFGERFLASRVPSYENGSHVSNIEGNRAELLTRSNKESRGSSMWRGLMLFMAGAAAGMTATIATYPFDIMRTQFALQSKTVVYGSMREFIGQTYSAKGLRGFYAGITPAVVGITPYMGMSFALYESFKSILLTEHPVSGEIRDNRIQITDGRSNIASKNSQPNNADSKTESDGRDNTLKATGAASLFKKGLCGGLSGGLSKFAVYPLDTVKKRLQAQVLQNTLQNSAAFVKYRGIIHCMHHIFVHEGIQGFYRGLVPTTIKSIAATAITFAAYEAAKDFLAYSRSNKEAAATRTIQNSSSNSKGSAIE